MDIVVGDPAEATGGETREAEVGADFVRQFAQQLTHVLDRLQQLGQQQAIVGGELTRAAGGGVTLVVAVEEFADELAQLRSTLALPPLESLDVDSDPELLRRYGHKIPVLLWDGAPIAVTRLDPGEIERLFRVR